MALRSCDCRLCPISTAASQSWPWSLRCWLGMDGVRWPAPLAGGCSYRRHRCYSAFGIEHRKIHAVGVSISSVKRKTRSPRSRHSYVYRARRAHATTASRIGSWSKAKQCVRLDHPEGRVDIRHLRRLCRGLWLRPPPMPVQEARSSAQRSGHRPFRVADRPTKLKGLRSNRRQRRSRNATWAPELPE